MRGAAVIAVTIVVEPEHVERRSSMPSSAPEEWRQIDMYSLTPTVIRAPPAANLLTSPTARRWWPTADANLMCDCIASSPLIPFHTFQKSFEGKLEFWIHGIRNQTVVAVCVVCGYQFITLYPFFF
jgi:hypothetical protein